MPAMTQHRSLMAWKMTRMKDFIAFPLCIKKDLINYSIQKLMEGKPWEKFDTDLNTSAFSYMTRSIWNAFVQWSKKEVYRQENIKYAVLRTIILDFNTKWSSERGITFNLSRVIDYDN